jgi:hypothetical protein
VILARKLLVFNGPVLERGYTSTAFLFLLLPFLLTRDMRDNMRCNMCRIQRGFNQTCVGGSKYELRFHKV